MITASSEEWNEAFDATVYDPDGWDRRDFERSWSEPITAEEFMRRWSRSTTLVMKPMRSVEEATARVTARRLENEESE